MLMNTRRVLFNWYLLKYLLAMPRLAPDIAFNEKIVLVYGESLKRPILAG